MIVIQGAAGARELVGQELGVSEWVKVDQALIDAFADTTGDHQWIHVDVDRARTSPFGTTIAHGLLTLGLGPRFSYEIYDFDGIAYGVNYGYGRVRFPAPVPADARLRMRAQLTAAEDVPGGVQLTITQTFEVEGATKPACVAEALVRIYESG
jgi:acyl dehydratase